MISDNIISSIEGVVINPLRIISDERGSVLHMMRCDSDGFTRFGECYFSEVLPGAVKAWKKHTAQTQNFTVPVGLIQLVIFDDWADSKTRNQLMILELGRPDKYIRVTIPPGLWYGFKCIGTTPALLANCADLPHDKAESLTRDLNDSQIPFTWGKDQ